MHLKTDNEIQTLLHDDKSPVPRERRAQLAEHITLTPDDTRQALYTELHNCELTHDELGFAYSLFKVGAPGHFTSPEKITEFQPSEPVTETTILPAA